MASALQTVLQVGTAYGYRPGDGLARALQAYMAPNIRKNKELLARRAQKVKLASELKDDLEKAEDAVEKARLKTEDKKESDVLNKIQKRKQDTLRRQENRQARNQEEINRDNARAQEKQEAQAEKIGASKVKATTDAMNEEIAEQIQRKSGARLNATDYASAQTLSSDSEIKTLNRNVVLKDAVLQAYREKGLVSERNGVEYIENTNLKAEDVALGYLNQNNIGVYITEEDAKKHGEKNFTKLFEEENDNNKVENYKQYGGGGRVYSPDQAEEEAKRYYANDLARAKKIDQRNLELLRQSEVEYEEMENDLALLMKGIERDPLARRGVTNMAFHTPDIGTRPGFGFRTPSVDDEIVDLETQRTTQSQEPETVVTAPEEKKDASDDAGRIFDDLPRFRHSKLDYAMGAKLDDLEERGEKTREQIVDLMTERQRRRAEKQRERVENQRKREARKQEKNKVDATLDNELNTSEDETTANKAATERKTKNQILTDYSQKTGAKQKDLYLIQNLSPAEVRNLTLDETKFAELARMGEVINDLILIESTSPQSLQLTEREREQMLSDVRKELERKPLGVLEDMLSTAEGVEDLNPDVVTLDENGRQQVLQIVEESEEAVEPPAETPPIQTEETQTGEPQTEETPEETPEPEEGAFNLMQRVSGIFDRLRGGRRVEEEEDAEPTSSFRQNNEERIEQLQKEIDNLGQYGIEADTKKSSVQKDLDNAKTEDDLVQVEQRIKQLKQ